MEARELNEAMAREVMGWVPEPENPTHFPRWMLANGMCTPHTIEEIGGWGWSPSTRWDHAGLVLERMQALGWEWRIFSTEPHWAAECLTNAHSVHERGQSGPEAICRAALAAVRAKR